MHSHFEINGTKLIIVRYLKSLFTTIALECKELFNNLAISNDQGIIIIMLTASLLFQIRD